MAKSQAEIPNLEETQQRLARLVELGGARLREMTPSTGVADDERWSIHQRLGHLIDAAANHHQHLVRAQLDELLSFPSLEADPWVSVQPYDETPWDELVQWWVLQNQHLLRLMERIPAAKREMPCLIGRMKPVTLERLCAEYAKLVSRHLKQLCGEELE